MRLLRAALLLCALCPGALPHVAAPEDVRVWCGDQRPLVTWKHSSQQPTNFTVRLWGSGEHFSASTRNHKLDLSDFVWTSSTQMYEYHYVNVTAEQGPDRSMPTQSPSFTYNIRKPANQKCSLKFLPMNLMGEGPEATLAFENPLYFFNELRTIRESAVLRLSIDTESEKSEEPHSGANQDRECRRERICMFSVNLTKKAEPCVNLTGFIEYGKAKEEIEIQHLDPVCIAASTDELSVIWVVAILSVVVIVCVISFVTFGVCKYRAWVFPKIPTPQTLISSSQSFRPSISKPVEVSPIQITGPRLRTISDHESLSSPETFKVQDEDQVIFLPKDLEVELDASAGSTETETVSLHSSGSEIEESNYERRVHVVEMDVSGDLVTGYTS